MGTRRQEKTWASITYTHKQQNETPAVVAFTSDEFFASLNGRKWLSENVAYTGAEVRKQRSLGEKVTQVDKALHVRGITTGF